MSALLLSSITSDSGLLDLVKLPEENQKGVTVVWKILLPLLFFRSLHLHWKDSWSERPVKAIFEETVFSYGNCTSLLLVTISFIKEN